MTLMGHPRGPALAEKFQANFMDLLTGQVLFWRQPKMYGVKRKSKKIIGLLHLNGPIS